MFVFYPEIAITVLKSKNQDSGKNNSENNDKIYASDIFRNSRKGKKRNFLYDFSAFFAEKRKKEEHYHAAVQKAENDIAKVFFPLP